MGRPARPHHQLPHGPGERAGRGRQPRRHRHPALVRDDQGQGLHRRERERHPRPGRGSACGSGPRHALQGRHDPVRDVLGRERQLRVPRGVRARALRDRRGRLRAPEADRRGRLRDGRVRRAPQLPGRLREPGSRARVAAPGRDHVGGDDELHRLGQEGAHRRRERRHRRHRLQRDDAERARRQPPGGRGLRARRPRRGREPLRARARRQRRAGVRPRRRGDEGPPRRHLRRRGRLVRQPADGLHREAEHRPRSGADPASEPLPGLPRAPGAPESDQVGRVRRRLRVRGGLHQPRHPEQHGSRAAGNGVRASRRRQVDRRDRGARRLPRR